MIGKPGPFQIVENDGHGVLEDPISPPRRRFSCENYETCLNLAAALNWDSFTCRGCSGEINDALLWRARQALRKDSFLIRLCNLPHARMHTSDDEPEPHIRLVAKR